jgi:hypothetical protein
VTGPILDRLPPGRRLPDRRAPVPGTGTHARPRFEPRNLAFADGLDRWHLGFEASDEPGRPGERDYTAAVEAGSAILTAAGPEAAGSATLMQTIFADDYRGVAVVFSGRIRTEGVPRWAGLRLDIVTRPQRAKAEPGERGAEIRHERQCVTVSGRGDWSAQEVTAQVPDDAELIMFGVALAGPGVVALRSPELTVGT